jgi:hypothetical protein
MEKLSFDYFNKNVMRIPLIPASDSSRSRSPIPGDSGHPFQMIAAR